MGFASCKNVIVSIHSHSQHSGARRAHEAAHGDVGVRHPGLVALEAVFVYSGLGQLPDLAGADLLVVPVLSVRHLAAAPQLHLLLRCPAAPVNRDHCRSLPSSATRSTSRPALCKTRWCGFSLSVRSNGGVKASS